MSFQFQALAADVFTPLFSLDAEALAASGAARRIVTSKPGFPCRISLEDAEVGEEVILTHFEHQPANSPFRAGHAVYVRPAAEQAHPAVGEVPALLRTRVLSLRAFDAAGMMLDAKVAPGSEVERALEELLAEPATDYLHVHFAGPGCYAARVNRA